MYDNTGTICMTSYEYIWHHIQSLWYHTMLWHSLTLYSCHHTQDTCHCIHCSCTITYSVLIISHLQYVRHQTHYIYDIIWIICAITPTLYDITTLFMTSLTHYSWHHNRYIWHHIHSICDITATVTMTRHLLCFLHYTQCIWHLTWWMNDNTTTVSDMIPNVSV